MTDRPDEDAGFVVICPTTLADVLDREQVMDGGICPLWGPMPRLAGRAFTVSCAPADNLMLHAAIHRAAPGPVIVVQAGDAGYAVAGGNVCAVAQRNGIAGFVVADEEGVVVVPGDGRKQVLRDARARLAAEAGESLDAWEAAHRAQRSTSLSGSVGRVTFDLRRRAAVGDGRPQECGRWPAAPPSDHARARARSPPISVRLAARRAVARSAARSPRASTASVDARYPADRSRVPPRAARRRAGGSGAERSRHRS